MSGHPQDRSELALSGANNGKHLRGASINNPTPGAGLGPVGVIDAKTDNLLRLLSVGLWVSG